MDVLINGTAENCAWALIIVIGIVRSASEETNAKRSLGYTEGHRFPHHVALFATSFDFAVVRTCWIRQSSNAEDVWSRPGARVAWSQRRSFAPANHRSGKAHL